MNFGRSKNTEPLRVDGICGSETWTALVESGFRLGDRMLYVRRPMLRGDDVVELQRRLNTLGFDAGKEDGIFGPDTARQRSPSSSATPVSGATASSDPTPPTRWRGSARSGSAPWPRARSPACAKREVLRRGPHRIEGRRVFLAVAPGFGALADLLMRGLVEAGATVVLESSGADDSALAAEANRYDADLFFAVRPGDEPGCRCCYCASGPFRSEAGFRSRPR